MVYWGKNYRQFLRVFTPVGAVVSLTHLHRLPVGLARRRTTDGLFK
jgi:hypothetical protein